MTKVSRTYRFDATVVEKLRELAEWKRRDMTAQLSVMIEEAHATERQRRVVQIRSEERQA